jgi:hypothetical protein
VLHIGRWETRLQAYSCRCLSSGGVLRLLHGISLPATARLRGSGSVLSRYPPAWCVARLCVGIDATPNGLANRCLPLRIANQAASCALGNMVEMMGEPYAVQPDAWLAWMI